MTTEGSPTPRDQSLVNGGLVHGDLYRDPHIFERELDQIWSKSWVYIGHQSEVPQPNDWVRKTLGVQPIIMVRGSDNEVRVLLNRCPHRGNELCVHEHGNSRTFTCPYHAWKFSNDGTLLGRAFPAGYGDSNADTASLGLAPVPRVESYRGFVFGCMREDVMPLADHLGDAARAIDQLCENSPVGEIELTSGFLRHRTQANWKFILENECDGYHPAFVHSSIFSVADSGIGRLYGPDSPALSRDFGNGHTEIDLRPAFRELDQPLAWFGTDSARFPDYLSSMESAYGSVRARSIMVDGPPHIMIFPNLFIAEIQIFVIQPVAVDESIQNATAIQFKGAPELNRRLVRQATGSVGPAGMLLADDTAMYERNQRGLYARQPEHLYLRRGEHREQTEDSGSVVGQATDEVASRGIWRHYAQLMA